MPDLNNLLVIGGGGHAHVIADAAHAARRYKQICLLSPGPVVLKEDPRFSTHLGDLDVEKFPPGSWGSIVAIGDAAIREQKQSELLMKGYQLSTIVHPSAYVSESATIGQGTVILAGAVVQTSTSLSEGVIINNNATVDHHCSVDRFTHICPGVSIAGGNRIGARCTIGTGASVRPNCTIADDTMIGAGSAVVGDLASGTWAGVPAKNLHQK